MIDNESFIKKEATRNLRITWPLLQPLHRPKFKFRFAGFYPSFLFHDTQVSSIALQGSAA